METPLGLATKAGFTHVWCLSRVPGIAGAQLGMFSLHVVSPAAQLHLFTWWLRTPWEGRRKHPGLREPAQGTGSAPLCPRKCQGLLRIKGRGNILHLLVVQRMWGPSLIHRRSLQRSNKADSFSPERLQARSSVTTSLKLGEENDKPSILYQQKHPPSSKYFSLY